MFSSKSKSDLTVFVVGIFIIRKVKINVHIGFISSSGRHKTLKIQPNEIAINFLMQQHYSVS